MVIFPLIVVLDVLIDVDVKVGFITFIKEGLFSSYLNICLNYETGHILAARIIPNIMKNSLIQRNIKASISYISVVMLLLMLSNWLSPIANFLSKTKSPIDVRCKAMTGFSNLPNILFI